MAEEENKTEKLEGLLKPLLKLYEKVLEPIARNYSEGLIDKKEFYRKKLILEGAIVSSVHEFELTWSLVSLMHEKYDEIRRKYRIESILDRFPRRFMD